MPFCFAFGHAIGQNCPGAVERCLKIIRQRMGSSGVVGNDDGFAVALGRPGIQIEAPHYCGGRIHNGHFAVHGLRFPEFMNFYAPAQKARTQVEIAAVKSGDIE